MKKLISKRAFVAGALALYACPALVADPSAGSRPLGGIAFHYVGRVKLNLVESSGTVYGYITAVSALDSFAPLFSGAPGEATAYLTFRADIKFNGLPGNGPLGPGQFAVTPILVDPGTWSIYFTPNPAHNWDSPDTFSNGQVVATMDRPVEQFSVYPTFAINAGAATVRSATPFTLAGRTIDVRELAPRGFVDVTSGSPIPLAGSTPFAPIFAVSGYALVSAR